MKALADYVGDISSRDPNGRFVWVHPMYIIELRNIHVIRERQLEPADGYGSVVVMPMRFYLGNESYYKSKLKYLGDEL